MRLVVIGGGPGGYEAAAYAAKRGMEVTLVEEKQLGGTCLNVGCIPTKALLASADALQAARNAKDYGILAGEVSADYPAVVARKDKIVSILVKGVAQTLQAAGVTLLQGHGSLAGPGTVHVQLNEGGETQLQADAILLATGSSAAVPAFLQGGGDAVLSSDDILALQQPPASILVAGGGVIGCEIGQFLSRMGSSVTIVEQMPHLLPLEDEDTAKALERQFKRERIKAVCGTGIAGVEKTADGVAAALADGRKLEAEVLLAAVGRRPYTQGLGLEEAGVATDARGFVQVNEAMCTNVPGVYAIGDILPTPQLAHVATREGLAAVDHMLGGSTAVPYQAVPRCVYTAPEVAAVGVTEVALQQQGRPYKLGRFDFVANGKARAAGHTEGFVKLLANENDVLLGAVIVGAHATEMLGALTLGVQLGLGIAHLTGAIYPHPTMSEGILEALHNMQPVK